MTGFLVVGSVVLAMVVVGLPLAYAVLGDERPQAFFVDGEPAIGGLFFSTHRQELVDGNCR